MDENYTKIILAVIAVIATIVGGALISIKKSKKRTNKVNQENITIKGNKNKVVGGDDNSKN